MELGLAGRHVLITGGSKGIGRACADAFGAEGCRLTLVARSAPDLDAAAGEVRAVHGVEVATKPLDLSDPAQQRALADDVGAVDVVVNNAGAIPAGNLQRVDDEAWRQAWDLKVLGYVNLCRLLLPRLEDQGRGVIVNVIGGPAPDRSRTTSPVPPATPPSWRSRAPSARARCGGACGWWA
jgi:3-oxoacyl-[acyl-carrier protein] reductase